MITVSSHRIVAIIASSESERSQLSAGFPRFPMGQETGYLGLKSGASMCHYLSTPDGLFFHNRSEGTNETSRIETSSIELSAGFVHCSRILGLYAAWERSVSGHCRFLCAG